MVQIEEVFDYDFNQLMDKVKKKEIHVVIPSFFGLTMASEVLRTLAPRWYTSDKGEEFQKAVKENFESGQFVGTSCCVFPHYHNYPEMDEMVKWFNPEEDDYAKIREAKEKSFRDILDLEVNTLKTRDMFFILDDVHLLLQKTSYSSLIKKIATIPEYRDKIDRIRISMRR